MGFYGVAEDPVWHGKVRLYASSRGVLGVWVDAWSVRRVKSMSSRRSRLDSTHSTQIGSEDCQKHWPITRDVLSLTSSTGTGTMEFQLNAESGESGGFVFVSVSVIREIPRIKSQASIHYDGIGSVNSQIVSACLASIIKTLLIMPLPVRASVGQRSQKICPSPHLRSQTPLATVAI